MDSEVLSSVDRAPIVNNQSQNHNNQNHSQNPNERHFQAQVAPIPLLDPLLRLLLLTIQLVWTQFHLTARFVLFQYHRIASGWKRHYRARLCALENIPTHIAIGINHPVLDYTKLGQLIDWCRTVPTIRTVTIYHPYARHDQQDPDELKRILEPEQDSQSQGSTNFEVCFLDPKSGRQSLIDAARHFATLSLSSESDDPHEPVTADQVSEYLKRDYPHPDPQLLLVFGDAQIYNGFPCWQIRLTETVFFPPLDWLTLSQFYDALYRYTKCEQRFGK